MAPRIHIPAIALLGLQLTECSSPEDPLVGDWLAVEVDGVKHPLTESDYGNSFTFGFELHVEPGMTGMFSYYYTSEYDDIRVRGEYSFPLTVDDDSPRYLLSITIPGLGGEPGGGEDHADGGDPRDSEGYADGGEPLVAVDRLDGLTATPRRSAASGTLLLDCTLGAEFLTCTRTSDGDGWTDIRFARAPEDT